MMYIMQPNTPLTTSVKSKNLNKSELFPSFEILSWFDRAMEGEVFQCCVGVIALEAEYICYLLFFIFI